jgi:5-methyltetrahydropteroyltriglutamate--homocysteine methyltransferase
MTTHKDRVVTTHVGSLVRAPDLVDFLHAIDAGKPYDEAAYDETLSQAIRTVVRQQSEAGIDIVSDGEFSKGKNWAFYIHDRLAGIERRELAPEQMTGARRFALGGRDRETFPEFYAQYYESIGLKNHLAFQTVCTGPLRYIGQDAIARDIGNLKAAAAEANVGAAFLPVVSPASALPDVKNEHYPDEQSLLFALADALRDEYRAVVDAGLLVQIDEGFLPYMYERLVPPMTLAQYRSWAELRIEALNRALHGIPQDRVRFHICWGSWNGPHMFDVPLKDIVDLVLNVNAGAYLFEAANPRHEHEWRVWETVDLPVGKILVPGLISHSTNVVEHPELVAERLVRFAKIVGRERVMAGTDCGFAQTWFVNRVHPTIMWAKLRALSEGARLATAALWGRRTAA